MEKANHPLLISILLVINLVLSGLILFFICRAHHGPMIAPSARGLDTIVLDSEKSNHYKTPYELHHVKNTITKNMKTIQDCYLSFLATNPETVDGKIVVEWQIDREGDVFAADMVSTDFQSKAFNLCIPGKISKWHFPAPPSGNPVYTSHIFNFNKS